MLWRDENSKIHHEVQGVVSNVLGQLILKNDIADTYDNRNEKSHSHGGEKQPMPRIPRTLIASIYPSLRGRF